jgi:hypothetical protein
LYVARVPRRRSVTPGYVVIYPNRRRAASHAVKAIVVLLLVISAGLMLTVTIGGWSELQGLAPLDFIWAAAYLVIAYYVWRRWARGLLPISAGLGVLLLMDSLVAGLGLSGTSWFTRTDFGYAHARALFGGPGLGGDVLGTLTLLLVPIQILLIFFAMRGFQQAWNVEVEVPEEEAEQQRPGVRRPPQSPPSAATV